MTEFADKSRAAGYAVETIHWSRDEVAGYLYAGMLAKKAIKKWGGHQMAKYMAEKWAQLCLDGIPKSNITVRKIGDTI